MNEQPDKARKNVLREAQKQIVRSSFFALAALAVIVFACYAWFANNRTVTGEIGSVRLSGSNFELASVGGVGAFDEMIENRADEGSDWNHSNLTGKITGQGTDIRWRVSADDTYKSDFENASTEIGISPGKTGKLRFYVVPQKSGPGTLTLKFDTKLIPLDYRGTQIVDSTLENLLRGHILFTLEKVSENPEQKLNFSETPYSFQLTFNVDSDCTPIEVCLTWEWLYSCEIATSKFGTEFVNENKNRAFFFYNYENSIDALQYNAAYYDNGDQYIGEKTDYLLFQLSAEEVFTN